MKLEEAKPLIVKEWLKRPVEQRTENDLLAFYGQLQTEDLYLLSFKCSGDKYQRMKSILKGHIK
jgi:hypothetical protein